MTFDTRSPADKVPDAAPDAARPAAAPVSLIEPAAPLIEPPPDLSPVYRRALRIGFGLLGSSVFLVGLLWGLHRPQPPVDPSWAFKPTPLVKQGGDPYLRALMRTISVAESNSTRPYSLLYGGEHFSDLSRHPDDCVPIVAGPNVGNCTTAAGRYQFITTTWDEQAARYHPKAGQWFVSYLSFAPEYQDEVVYRWLNDPQD